MLLFLGCTRPSPSERLAFISEQGSETWLYIAQIGNSVTLEKIASAVTWRTPVWSPDGQKLAFLDEQEGGSSLYVVDVNSLRIQRVTDEIDVRLYAWDPSGEFIALSAAHENNDDIFLVSLDGQSSINLTPNNQSADCCPVWSQNGNYIAFLSANNVTSSSLCREGCKYKAHVMNRDGTDNRRITKDKSIVDAYQGECYLTWSPDDHHLAFTSGCYPTENMNIYRFSFEENSLLKLTSDHADDRFSTWCSDGKMLFRSFRGERERLYIMDQDGQNQRRVPWDIEDVNLVDWTDDCQHFVWQDANTNEILIGDLATQQVISTGIQGCSPTWLSSGDWIAFTTQCLYPEESDIWIMNNLGKDVLNLTTEISGNSFNPVWSP